MKVLNQNLYIGLLGLVCIAAAGCQGVGFSPLKTSASVVKAGNEVPPNRPAPNEECVVDDSDSSSEEGVSDDPRCPPNQHVHERGTWGLCYLNAGPGVSQRIGYSDPSGEGSRILVVESAVARDICMSPNACTNIINTYLNLTRGNLAGVPGAPNNPAIQYTSFLDRSNSVCQHNPNVARRNDGNIQNDVNNLMRRALGQ